MAGSKACNDVVIAIQVCVGLLGIIGDYVWADMCEEFCKDN